MDDLSHLPPRTQTELFRALESAVTIRHRGELFLWAQGPLQALIPHGLMLGFMLNDEQQVSHTDCLQAVVLEAGKLEALRHPKTGLVVRIAQRCRELGLMACQLPACAAEHAPLDIGADLQQEWRELDLGHGMFQGSGPLAGGDGSFFALLGLTQPPQSTQALLLQVLLPQLHVALSRSQRYGTLEATPDVVSASDTQLSERQLEILHWVKLGKTNHEIALILDISELTVKNHMQKLFKKLNVHNRAQAVAKVMSTSRD